MRSTILSVMTAVLLAACSSGERQLHDLRDGSTGPDEFSVIPSRPLVAPSSLDLPEPTPGGINRADPNPIGDTITALGGSQSANVAGGIPATDTALVTQASRYGVDTTVRAELAATDQAFRDRKRRAGIFNILGNGRYFPAYARQALDAHAELLRLRNLGISTPTAPATQ